MDLGSVQMESDPRPSVNQEADGRGVREGCRSGQTAVGSLLGQRARLQAELRTDGIGKLGPFRAALVTWHGLGCVGPCEEMGELRNRACHETVKACLVGPAEGGGSILH